MRRLCAPALLAVLVASAAPAAASAAGPFGTYRLVDPIQRPEQFTLRLMRSGKTCRRVAHTRYACFTLSQRGSDELTGVGRLRVAGRRLTFTDGSVAACPGVAGRYTWRLRGSALRVSGARDACAGRRHLFLAGPWKRRG